jgi:alpha-ketoglutarate-dependent taurine dioxygenase
LPESIAGAVNHGFFANGPAHIRRTFGDHAASATDRGLACVRQAPAGGRSRLVSAAQAHEALRERSPDLLRRLYGRFVRDVVTPGGDRRVEQVRANRFPIFSYEGRLALRYMRYWIERGHGRIDEPLEALDLAAFDALDAVLADPAHVLAFHMSPGDLMFIDNTTIAHDRDAYVDDPAAPRLLLRLWLDHRPASRYASA